jgi:hypothetical protein
MAHGRDSCASGAESGTTIADRSGSWIELTCALGGPNTDADRGEVTQPQRDETSSSASTPAKDGAVVADRKLRV